MGQLILKFKDKAVENVPVKTKAKTKPKRTQIKIKTRNVSKSNC
jgi:hypothetical protein